jgi:imidazolonepropionase-like amidohydrolase
MSVEETRAFMNTPMAQLVSLRRRSRWPEGVQEEGASSAKIWALAPGIFQRLRAVTDRFIAGTDSGGGYPNSVSGFALLDELETFESLGMTPAEVLKTATVNASIALGDPSGFGTIEAGKRADLVLLDAPNLLHLVYHYGINPVAAVVKDGKVVRRAG